MKACFSLAILLASSATLSGDENLERQVDAIFAAYDHTGSPGCAVGIVRDGEFVYKRGYGMASIELGAPLSPASIFYMGSVSKQFTAASIVLAAEKGYLSLDDDLRKWIPGIPSYGHTITLRHMLHHTSGIRDEIGLVSLAGGYIEDVHPTAEIIDLIARQKALNFNPGDEYQYSNSNYFLLAEVLHRASGMPLSRFADENIFKPLGMTHTRFYDDRTFVLPQRVAAYAPHTGGGFRVDWSTNFEKVGDGGLMSSVDDLLPWDRNFYQNKLGKGSLLRELQTRGTLNSGKTITYALGLQISAYHGLPIVEHGGALFGYRTEVLRFPEQKFSVFCLCNLSSGDPGAKARRIADIYLAGQFPASSARARTGNPAAESHRSPAAIDISRLRGMYRDPGTRTFVDVTIHDQELRAGDLVLRRAADVFVDPNGVEYRFEAAETGLRMVWNDAQGKRHVLQRIEPATPTPAELAGYAGDYFSDELLATYKVRGKNNKLIITVGWNDPVELQPSLRDEFAGRLNTEFREPIVIQFVREGSKVIGFDLSAGFGDGVRNIRFVRK